MGSVKLNIHQKADALIEFTKLVEYTNNLEYKVKNLDLFDIRYRKIVAWACKTCNKVDWADSKEQLAKPEHVPYRGIDLGTCKGKFIPLYDAQ